MLGAPHAIARGGVVMRRINRRRAYHLIGLSAVFAGLAGPAHAYIDPGTGSILMQMIVAGLAAGGSVVGIYWSRLRSLFSRRRDRSPDQS